MLGSQSPLYYDGWGCGEVSYAGVLPFDPWIRVKIVGKDVTGDKVTVIGLCIDNQTSCYMHLL